MFLYLAGRPRDGSMTTHHNKNTKVVVVVVVVVEPEALFQDIEESLFGVEKGH